MSLGHNVISGEYKHLFDVYRSKYENKPIKVEFN